MRTYTFKRECGHTVRGVRRAKSLSRPCTECIFEVLKFVSLPKGFFLWSESLQVEWVNQQREKQGVRVEGKIKIIST